MNCCCHTFVAAIGACVCLCNTTDGQIYRRTDRRTQEQQLNAITTMHHNVCGPSHGPFDLNSAFLNVPQMWHVAWSMGHGTWGNRSYAVGAYLDALLSGVQVDALHGILDVLRLHLHAAIALIPCWRLRRNRWSTATT